jgi:hypothetical protein
MNLFTPLLFHDGLKIRRGILNAETCVLIVDPNERWFFVLLEVKIEPFEEMADSQYGLSSEMA